MAQILTLIVTLLTTLISAEGSVPSAVPTFNSIGIYWNPPEGSDEVECFVQYRVKGTVEWKTGLSFWYDYRDAEYRGSIVELLPGTTYDISLDLAGAGVTETFEASTWEENFPIAQTIELAENSNTSLLINQSGTPDGYILYTYGATGSATIDVNNNFDTNIEIDASYIIIRGLTLKNAAIHAIKILDDNHDIVIEKCDISGWGRIEYAQDGEIWGFGYDSAIFSGGEINYIERVII